MNQPAKQAPAADILIVDDTPANLQFLAGMLKKQGHKVRPVPGGKLALEAARRELPDLILLDINMPEMDGYEVCKELKANPLLAEIPVIFISANTETTDKVKAFAIGGVDYVTKPFQFEEVDARVRVHLEIRRQKRALQENYDALKKLEELRDNLTHMIVHDMRSPLMGISICFKNLGRDAGKKLNTQEKEYITGGMESCSRLVEMVTSLLDVSKMEAGKMALNLVKSNIGTLAAEAIKSLGSFADAAPVLFDKPATAILIDCDANLIRRVIANLVGNSVKFTPKDGQVDVSIKNSGPEIKVTVADNGLGISPEYHAKIFEKFGQVEIRQEGKMCSTGLGLTFCKLAVETHGGRIGVESPSIGPRAGADGKGSNFWFTLPALSPVEGPATAQRGQTSGHPG